MFEIEVLDACLERLASVAWDGLTEPERNLVALRMFDSEVHNGALDQFFGNGSGEHALQAVRALRAMGAGKAALLLAEAMSLFPGGVVPQGRAPRRAALDSLAPQAIAAMDRLSDQLLDELAALHRDRLLERYVQSHDDEFLGPRTALDLWRSVRARGGDTSRPRADPVDWLKAAAEDRAYCRQPCPECRYPSPAYRNNCKRCGFPYLQKT